MIEAGIAVAIFILGFVAGHLVGARGLRELEAGLAQVQVDVIKGLRDLAAGVEHGKEAVDELAAKAERSLKRAKSQSNHPDSVV